MPQDDAVEAAKTAKTAEAVEIAVPAVPPEALRGQLVNLLRASGTLTDPAVERAMRMVPRHLFLPSSTLEDAYADMAVPTRFADGVPISSASQPAIVAAMLQQMRVEPGMRVLEIGAGTGYNAALLADLVGREGSVTTLDIDDEIVAEAREHLAAAGYQRVEAVRADGAFGWPASAPYNRVMLTVGAWDIAPAWYEQLAEGGLLELPLWLGGGDASVAFRKREGVLYSESLLPCGFMRLRGAEAGPERWLSVSNNRKLFVERADEFGPQIAELLTCRPRPHFWGSPVPQVLPFMQYLGLRGHHVVALHTDNPQSRRGRLRMRLGIYAEGKDGPSLVLIGALPMLLAFGGTAAERIVEDEIKRWSTTAQSPFERAQIVARPRAALGEMPAPNGTIRLTRRHFVYDVTL